MDRRTWLKLVGSAAAASFIAVNAKAQLSPDQPHPFSEDILETYVRDLSSKPYSAPERRLDDVLANISYDQYRDIRYKPENVIWREDSLNFRFDMFQAAGAFYSYPIEIHTVEAGRAVKIPYTSQLFTFGGQVRTPQPASQSGFAGLRLRAPLNETTVFDDFLFFLGASYFRAIGAGQIYGLSARGLAVNTAQSGGEEFPLFRSFWVERPLPGETKIIVHALLDSASAAGRYKFTITPGRNTTLDVETAIYPRRRIPYVGIAPMTGMFFFAPSGQPKRRDFRLRVHDTEALSMLNGSGEWILRPLINPERLQFSVFSDRNPKGFGLVQRTRNFSEYQDLDKLYEKCPSLWIEPIGEWGEGFVDLIEVPAQDEPRDNIVAFWRPKDGLGPGIGHRYRYKMHWGWDLPIKSNLAAVMQTRLGDARNGEGIFVLDFAGTESCEGCAGNTITPTVSASSGEVRNISLTQNVRTGGHRLTFQYAPSSGQADLRALLTAGGRSISETWIFRWAR